MPIYNIQTSETRSYYSTDGWNLNIGSYRINENDQYDPVVIEHTNGSHILVLDNTIEPASASSDRFYANCFIDSSTLPNKYNNDTVSDPLINLQNNPDIAAARLGRPIHNSAPGWRYNS